ncbi:hypothetical protein TRIUR3_14200 [Triticum urartu]|uniref:Uncharacterized protein n=1 Tax=Triticum urartu TaxID=4572 RepID=M7YV05_TRIUA|nr:hypothetical protein TRIUR3_14200 [Triticum urartu]
MDVVSKRFALFGFIAGWSIATTAETETGPTFQLALAVVSCIYFLDDKMKNLSRASTTGLGLFASGWVVGLLGGLRRPPKPAEVMPYFCLRLPAPLLHTTKGDGEIRLLLSLFFYYIFSSEKFSFAQDGSSTAGGTSNSGVSLDCSFCLCLLA